MKTTEENDQPSPLFDEKSERRVIVKFREENIRLPYEDGAEKYFEGEWKERWAKLTESFRGISLKRVYTSVEPARIVELTLIAAKLDPTYMPTNFLTFFAIDAPGDSNPYALSEIINTWEIADYAYVESPPAPLPAQPSGMNPSLNKRHYLEPPQVGIPNATHIGGINARYAWNLEQSGAEIGAGKGITFIDIEKGWNLNHRELAGAAIKLVDGINKNDKRHGTNVLGILVAQDNDWDGVGIAYQSTGKVVSGWETDTSTNPNWHNAIMIAANTLGFGDVLLLEAQIWPSGTLLPLELESLSFNEVRIATALQITVIESAGNGGKLLDTQVNNFGKQILDPTHPDFNDSGAILVGAANPFGSVAKRRPSSNYGARVDCFAWGANVSTTDTDDDGTDNTLEDRPDFSATSAATAIVAGAAIIIQGIAKAYNLGNNANHTYSPTELRNILRNPNYGTASSDQIGMMPDLKKFIDIKIPPPQPVGGGNVPKPCFLMVFFRGLFKRIQWAGNRYIALKKDTFRLKP